LKKVLLIVLMLAGCVAANSDVIKTDPLFPGTYRQFDSNGHFKGTLKRDPLFPDRVRVTDENGNLKGTWKPDPLFKDRYQFHEKNDD